MTKHVWNHVLKVNMATVLRLWPNLEQDCGLEKSQDCGHVGKVSSLKMATVSRLWPNLQQDPWSMFKNWKVSSLNMATVLQLWPNLEQDCGFKKSWDCDHVLKHPQSHKTVTKSQARLWPFSSLWLQKGHSLKNWDCGHIQIVKKSPCWKSLGTWPQSQDCGQISSETSQKVSTVDILISRKVSSLWLQKLPQSQECGQVSSSKTVASKILEPVAIFSRLKTVLVKSRAWTQPQSCSRMCPNLKWDCGFQKSQLWHCGHSCHWEKSSLKPVASKRPQSRECGKCVECGQVLSSQTVASKILKTVAMFSRLWPFSRLWQCSKSLEKHCQECGPISSLDLAILKTVAMFKKSS